MFKINNRTMPMALLVTCTNFTLCSSVSLVNLDHVNTEWGGYTVLRSPKGPESVFV